MAKHYAGVSVLDYSEETSSTSFSIGAITAVSIAGFLTQFGNWKTALGNIILGTVSKDRWVGDATDISNTPPVDTNAQIELKWMVSYEGATTKKRFRQELPTADTSKLIPGTDMADLTDTDVAAYVTAFEAVAKSPDDDTEGVNVLDITLVGRNV
jgi:hypothetical protein